MTHIFEIIDKNSRLIYLTLERLKHIQKHSHMYDPIELIKITLQRPTTVRYEEYEDNLYFYREFREINQYKRYLLVVVNYLNLKTEIPFTCPVFSSTISNTP